MIGLGLMFGRWSEIVGMDHKPEVQSGYLSIAASTMSIIKNGLDGTCG